MGRPEASSTEGPEASSTEEVIAFHSLTAHFSRTLNNKLGVSSAHFSKFVSTHPDFTLKEFKGAPHRGRERMILATLFLNYIF